MSSPTRYLKQAFFSVLFAGFVLHAPMLAQDVLGGITGTVKDATGAAVPDATVRAQNIGTNLEVVQHTQANGSYSMPEPAGRQLPADLHQGGIRNRNAHRGVW